MVLQPGFCWKKHHKSGQKVALVVDLASGSNHLGARQPLIGPLEKFPVVDHFPFEKDPTFNDPRYGKFKVTVYIIKGSLEILTSDYTESCR